MLKRNQGTLDQIARLAVATVLLPAGLIWLGGLQGNVGGLFAAVIGGFGLLSGLTGVCPLYIPFGFSTLETEKKHFAPQKPAKMAQTGPGNKLPLPRSSRTRMKAHSSL